MKKLIILGVLLMSVICSNASTDFITVTRSKKGLFGYKYVDETHTTYGHELDCSNPGYKTCKWKTLPPAESGSYGSFTDADYEAIDRNVYGAITETHTSGQLVYRDCLVVYTYNAETETLQYKIYDHDEAIEAGYSF